MWAAVEVGETEGGGERLSFGRMDLARDLYRYCDQLLRKGSVSAKARCFVIAGVVFRNAASASPRYRQGAQGLFSRRKCLSQIKRWAGHNRV
jgi:hypothetical protein